MKKGSKQPPETSHSSIKLSSIVQTLLSDLNHPSRKISPINVSECRSQRWITSYQRLQASETFKHDYRTLKPSILHSIDLREREIKSLISPLFLMFSLNEGGIFGDQRKLSFCPHIFNLSVQLWVQPVRKACFPRMWPDVCSLTAVRGPHRLRVGVCWKSDFFCSIFLWHYLTVSRQ